MRRFRFPVEAGQILQFARAVGEENPIYGTDGPEAAEARGGVIAPPTFTQAADHYDPVYDRRPSPELPWIGSGREAIGSDDGPRNTEGGSGFHAEQRFEYHRPVRPGQVLTVEVRPGKTWEKEGRRGGRLRFRETISEFRDEDGELVVTAVFVGVRTEKAVD
jgi:hypothetical protein